MHNIYVEVQLDGDGLVSTIYNTQVVALCNSLSDPGNAQYIRRSAIGWRWTCKDLKGAQIHVMKPFGGEAQPNWCNIVQLFVQTICTKCSFVSPTLSISITIIIVPSTYFQVSRCSNSNDASDQFPHCTGQYNMQHMHSFLIMQCCRCISLICKSRIVQMS